MLKDTDVSDEKIKLHFATPHIGFLIKLELDLVTSQSEAKNPKTLFSDFAANPKFPFQLLKPKVEKQDVRYKRT